jgi:glycosyltransferase involved in cell wall biosynthesis
MQGKNTYISMIIPAFNAGTFLEDNIRILDSLLLKLKRPYEIIVVIDGDSKNEKASEIAETLKKIFNKRSEIKIHAYPVNKGKGYAVRYGMKKAKGKLIGFIDAGYDIDYKGLLPMISALEKEEVDGIIGSKRHSQSDVEYPFIRKLYSAMFYFFIKLLLRLPFKDTQVGLKVFRREAIGGILPKLKVDGFVFDIELLALIIRKKGAKVIEAPVVVRLKETEKDSTMFVKSGFVLSSIGVFIDIIKVFYRINIGFYD